LSSQEKVTIALKPRATKEFANLVPTLVNWLQRRKKTVQFLETEKERLEKLIPNFEKKKINLITVSKMRQSDLVISLGGDGTLIGTARRLNGAKVPVFGVNLGHLGFITEFTKKEFFDELTNYFNGKLETEKINFFSAKVLHKGKQVFKEYFLNDAVCTKNELSRIIRISVENSEELIYDLDGDGIIVSTPIGSTAYSLAAGGPIVHSVVKTMILSPICAHSITHRPMCIPDTTKLTIKPKKYEENMALTLDGQVMHTISPTDQILIQKEKSKYLTIVRNKNKTYFHTLRDKFFHGRRQG
jgi:NAD+ kinase